MWLCKQCLEQIPEREKLTHEDFHLAMEMSKEPGALQARVQVFIQTHMLRVTGQLVPWADRQKCVMCTQ